MTNAELIDLFRNVEQSNHPVCNGCPMKYTCDKNQITRCLFGSAADALEAAEKRIAELEAQAESLKEESEAYKFGYLDGKTESDRQIEDLQTALTACRLRKGEAQLPKEGVWIPNSPFTGNCSECGARMDGERKDGAE